MNNKSVKNYFYPSLEDLPYIRSDDCKIAKDIAKRVLCLPLYIGLKQNELETIVILINTSVC